MQQTYTVKELVPYLNWIYFFHAWGFPARYAHISQIHNCISCRRQWISIFPSEEQTRAEEAIHLFDTATEMLSQHSSDLTIRCLFELFPCYSKVDDIILRRKDGALFSLPMLRQQTPNHEGYCLSVADFISEDPSQHEQIGVFCTSVSSASEDEEKPSLLFQTLCDRLAEAGAERLHEEVRKNFWGYAADEQLTPAEMFQAKYQGIRPAVGYPCLPDISINFLLDELIGFQKVGIRLTEHGMMIPHASVSGLMLSHPQAHYFSIGQVSEDQIKDYAQRRNLPVDMIRKYIC